MVQNKDYLRYFLLLFFTFISFPFVFSRQPGPGLDESWQIALNLAVQNDLIFGKEFIFTYGPLGILYTRLPIGVTKIVYLLFDLFFLCNFIFILNIILKKGLKFPGYLFLFIGLIIVPYEGAEQWYFFFNLFYLFTFLQDPTKNLYLFLSALLTILCFYFKLSLGSVGIFIFLLVIFYLIITKTINWKRGWGTLLIFFGALGIGAYLLNVNLEGYIFNSLQIISAYNDAMVLEGGSTVAIFLQAAVVILVMYGIFVISQLWLRFSGKEIHKVPADLVIYAVIGLYSFVLFKNGFLRGDGHNFYFFRGIVFVVSLLYLFYPGNSRKTIVALYCWAVISLSFWAVNTMPGGYFPYLRLVTLSIFPIKLEEIKKYFNDVNRYQTGLDNRHRNNKLKQIVGTSSIDVVPTEISQVYFNELDYNPRPIIQSYSAYNGYLDSLNNRKYISDTAPDYILYMHSSIDDRYPFFDEGRTKLAMISNYGVADQIEDQLLLSKLAKPKKLVQGETTYSLGSMGKDISIPSSSSLQFSQLFINYSLFGKIRRLFFRPPMLNMTITLESGEKLSYKGITSILSGGVIINKYIGSTEDFELFIRSNGLFNTNISRIRFEGGDGFQPEIKMKTTHFWLGDSSSTSLNHLDSVNMQLMFNRFKPVPMIQSEFATDTMTIWFDAVKTHSQFVNIKGWAFLQNKDNTSSKSTIILKSVDRLYELTTTNYYRPDLLGHYERRDIVQAAFSATTTKSELPPGVYYLGVRILNALNHTDAITFSDHAFVVKRVPLLEKIPTIKPTVNSGNLVFNVDLVKSEDGQILIEGWAFFKGENFQKCKTNIILQSPDRTFRVSTDQVLRNDLVNHFKDRTIAYAGFSVVLPEDKLPAGTYNIGVEEIQEEKNHREVFFSNKQLANKVSEISIPQKLGVLPSLGQFPSAIDILKDESDYLTISGWAVPEQGDFMGYRIELILRSSNDILLSDTRLNLRPDVTAYFNNKYKLDSCGFSSKIEKASIPPGKYEIGIYLHKQGKKGIVKFLDQYTVR